VDGGEGLVLMPPFQSLVQPKAYIVTQGPTESTMPDFWRMAWQEKASCIVMVTRTFDFIRVMCVQYWPAAKNREEVYGGVGITVESEEQLANFMIRSGLGENTIYPI
jgi:protein tyrosine phosphatase